MRYPSAATLTPVISLFVVAAVCSCLYLSSDIFGTAPQKPWTWLFGANSTHIKQTPEHLDLATVLKKAAMDNNNTVIITTLNEAWTAPGSIMDLFLESFRIGNETERLLRHLVIVAMDPNALQRCKSIHSNCFHLSTEGIDFSSEKTYMSVDYLKWMWRRVEFLKSVLDLGYNFVFTDTDIMWFRNPFLHFSENADMAIACDNFWGSSSNCAANAGFFYAKSNSKTVEFFKYWYMARAQYPGVNEQDIFNKIKAGKFVKETTMKISFLDTVYFGGFCQPSKDLNKVCTMHANCCIGVKSKIHDLRILLEDWKEYMAQLKKKSTIRKFSWRVPIQCKV